MRTPFDICPVPPCSPQDERRVYATISGSEEARDDLTTMLRENLRALFAEYKNLRVVEQMEWGGEWVPRATLEKMGTVVADEIAEVAALNLPPGGEEGMKPGRANKARTVRMFVSYSHENAAWCKRLLPVLKVKANVDTSSTMARHRT